MHKGKAYNMDNNVKTDVCRGIKKVPPKKPPRLSISRKPGSYPKTEQERRSSKEGVGSFFNDKNGFEDKEKRTHLDSTGSAGSPAYEVIEQSPINGAEKIEDLDIAVIEEEAFEEKEHIYEIISDHVTTKNTSSQTENCGDELRDHFKKAENFKVFKETSCQTEVSADVPETFVQKNNKRNSDSQDEDITAVGKSKESRLSSDSNTSTDESQGSADSGHFSVQVCNAEHSATTTEHSKNNDARYLWQPEGLSQEEVNAFMNSLPPDKVPSALTPERVAYFNTQLAYQNPKQDADPDLCQSLSKDQAVVLRSLWVNCLSKARGTGYIQICESGKNACKRCGEFFNKKDMVVAAGGGLHHPSCFSCTVCREFLTKLIYYSDGNQQLFCGRHYAELFKNRCFQCDELIVSGKVVQAMNHSWHAEHFCCTKCEKKITENKYTTENEKPICLDCHTTHFADKCEGCGQKITIGQKLVSHGNKHWHDECFICEKCENSLVLGTFNIGDDKVVCVECYQQKKNKLCHKCGEEIKNGSQLLDYNNHYFHSDCFCCKKCQQPIASGFVEQEESVYCSTCHRNLFSEKCSQCSLPVIVNGVTYGDEVWHAECFNCFNCEQPISSQRFLLRLGHRYCNGCYQKLFAKQCHACCELIKDGAYLTNNDFFWHNRCFTCAGCHKNLETTGFHMVEQKTYCSDCPGNVY